MTMRLPMLEKYVDERIGIWSAFGHSLEGTDINNGTEDVFTGLPPDVAEKVVAAHDRFREELYRLLCQ